MGLSAKKVMEIDKIELLDIIFALHVKLYQSKSDRSIGEDDKLLVQQITWYAREDPANPRFRKGGPASEDLIIVVFSSILEACSLLFTTVRFLN